MINIWIGDNRSKYIQTYLTTENETNKSKLKNIPKNSIVSLDIDCDYFIFEDSLEQNGFNASIMDQLPIMATEASNVVFMLGFTDCVYSCAWNTFNIRDIAINYAKTLKTLYTNQQSLRFYICSVCEVNADYPFAAYPGGIISSNTINTRIKQFNTILKEELVRLSKIKINNNNKKSFEFTYLDIAGYLTATGFDTYDGAKFCDDTAISIADYIRTNIKRSSNSFLRSRNSAPLNPGPEVDGYYWVNNLWTNKAGLRPGLNPFPEFDQSKLEEKYKTYEGDTLPDCRAYVWGRFYEITGYAPNFCANDDQLAEIDAERWFLFDGKTHDGIKYADDRYERGTEPALGAVICWKSEGNDAKNKGHLAIVEAINPDGSIVISESTNEPYTYSAYIGGRTAPDYWRKRTIKKDADGKWPCHPWETAQLLRVYKYEFQGFIYCPEVNSVKIIKSVSKSIVPTKNSYLSSEEMQTAALYIWNYLGPKGWTLNATAALISNMQIKGALSPRRVEPSTKVTGAISEAMAPAELKWYVNEFKNEEGRWPKFGLLQWQPKSTAENASWDGSTFVSWFTTRELNYEDIDNQLDRIRWEFEDDLDRDITAPSEDDFDDPYHDSTSSGSNIGSGIGDVISSITGKLDSISAKVISEYSWSNAYPIYAKNFKISRYPASYLAKVFLHNYFKVSTNKSSKDHTLFDSVAQQAELWYSFLAAYTPAADQPFALKDIKVQRITSTSIDFSFIASSCRTGKYTIYEAETGRIFAEVTLRDEVVSENNAIGKVVQLKHTDLVPNKHYKLKIEVEESSTTSKISETVEFTTLQSYPEAFNKIIITPNETSTPCNKFKLTVSPVNTDFGYWKSHGSDYGYLIQLIINGKVVAEKNVSILPTEIDVLKQFKYSVKNEDTVQLGVHTWVKDLSGSIVFDSIDHVCSNSICMLKNNQIVFINI